MYVWIIVIIFSYVYLSMCVCMYTYVCMYVCVHTYVQVVCLYVCIYACMYVYMCLCLYVYTSLYLYDLNHHHVCHVNENQDGDTALIYASIKGHKDIAKLLTDKGADLNLQDNVSAPLYV